MLVFTIAYIAAFICSRISFDKVSGIILISAAIYIYRKRYKETGNLLDLLGLYALGFIGAQGVACFKLSYLQNTWNYISWLCFYIAFIVPYTVHDVLHRRFKLEHKVFKYAKLEVSASMMSALYNSIVILTIISLSAFILEAVVLGYIPLFIRGVPHAYSYFHIRGVHYFTVACVLIPTLVCIYSMHTKTISKLKLYILIICSAIAVAIPILCVSRFQLIFAMVCALLSIILIKKDIPVKLLIYTMSILVCVYVVLSFARSHDVEYLNSIFEMRYKLPIYISQPYIYISNNYDNFNYLTENLPNFSRGLKMLYPFIALSGLKFLMPQLIDYPIYVVKEELSTLTLIYDAYYDFGIFGVILFGIFIAVLIFTLEYMISKLKNPVIYLFYVQISLYMMLAFFTTWFSNPTTWFYFALSGIIYLYLLWAEKNSRKN